MYTRYIEVKLGLVFIGDNHYIGLDLTNEFPSDVTFYIETDDDWWIVKGLGNEKVYDLKIQQTALKLLEKVEKMFEPIK
jgi:acyl-homoserine lactone acylase PvdQ